MTDKPDRSETLQVSSPSTDLLSMIGSVNFTWANLDALVSAAYIATIDGDPIETGITLGRMETIPKLERLRKILLHKKQAERAEIIRVTAKAAGKLKPLRNALTHGYYMGNSSQGEHFWAILPDFQIDEEFSGTGLFVATLEEIRDHQLEAIGLIYKILKAFEPEKLRRLFDLPTRVPNAKR